MKTEKSKTKCTKEQRIKEAKKGSEELVFYAESVIKAQSRQQRKQTRKTKGRKDKDDKKERKI